MEGQLNLFDIVAEQAKNEPLLKIDQTVWLTLAGNLVPGKIIKLWECPDHYSYDIEFSDGQCEIFKESELGVRIFLNNNKF